MIEIKDSVAAGGYTLMDLVCTERENAMLNCQIEQLHRAYMEGGYKLEERIALIFGWKDKPSE